MSSMSLIHSLARSLSLRVYGKLPSKQETAQMDPKLHVSQLPRNSAVNPD